MYCFDTDVLSATMKRPPARLVRRLAAVSPRDQFTTAVTVGELFYGARREGNPARVDQIRMLLERALHVLPFDTHAAEFYGELRARLESEGRRLDEPDLRIAAIALSNDLTLITGNVKHFARIRELRVENWLAEPPGRSPVST